MTIQYSQHQKTQRAFRKSDGSDCKTLVLSGVASDRFTTPEIEVRPNTKQVSSPNSLANGVRIGVSVCRRFVAHKSSAFIRLAMIVATLAMAQAVFAQAGLRESLDRLDVNDNGLIEPNEITPLARPYLERVMKVRPRRGEDAFENPLRIDKVQEAARIYYALKNGVSGRDVQPEGESSVKPFGPEPDEAYVPGFGIGKVRFPYVQADLNLADKIMSRYDDNGDGYIDRKEAANKKWTHRNPFDDDLNLDNRISKMELTQRYARRRLLNEDSDELGQRARRTGGEIASSTKDSKKDESQWWRQGGSSHWLTASMMGRFDRNRNGRLELAEAEQMGMPLVRIDLNRDGEVTRDELHALVTQLQKEAGDMTEGLPGWFYELDADRDGQVALDEFAETWTIAKHEEFESFDGNNDGFLTQEEVLQSRAMVGGSYLNDSAEILPPHRTIISEIEVTEDFLIRELSVQLSITHSNVGFLDGYLTGPDGERVELFTEVGGSGDHFDRTIFDDQSSNPITKGRPPFEGKFRPEAVDKRQPGLGRFKGKSVNGVWQLVIRGTRSERFGMLHSWALIVKPEEKIPTRPKPAIEHEGGSESVSDEAPPADSTANEPMPGAVNSSRINGQGGASGAVMDLLKKVTE